MGKRSSKKKAARNAPHPTMFAFEGVIKHYEDGSMIELFTKVTTEEWELIITETVQYKIFLDCLKDVAFPILHEVWTKEDEWFRVMLEHNIARMKNLNPMLFLPINQETIRKAFEDKIRRNATEVAEDIQRMRSQQQSWLGDRSDHSTTNVSEL